MLPSGHCAWVTRSWGLPDTGDEMALLSGNGSGTARAKAPQFSVGVNKPNGMRLPQPNRWQHAGGGQSTGAALMPQEIPPARPKARIVLRPGRPQSQKGSTARKAF